MVDFASKEAETNINRILDEATGVDSGTTDTDAPTNNEEGSETENQETSDKVDGSTSPVVDDDNPTKVIEKKPEGKEEKPARGPKDLTLADGTVVKAGAERRFYEQLGVAKQQLASEQQKVTRAEQELQTTRQQLEAFREAAQSASSLEPQQLGIAVRMYNDLSSDPVGTLQKLLAEAIAKGYSIEGISSGLDAKAIKRIVENAVQKETSSGTDDDDARYQQEAIAEWNAFTSTYPDALPHSDLISQMLSANPSMSLDGAYFALKSSFAERGLDFSKSLAAQQDALSDAAPKQQQKPMVNGRGNNAPVQLVNTKTPASSNKSLDDIIKESMREAGMNI